MWTSRTLWSTSQEGDFTARALDYLWISEAQRISRPTAPHLQWSCAPTLSAPFHQDGWTLACICSKLRKCISLKAADKEYCKETLSLLQSCTQLSTRAGVRMGQECGLRAREQAGHQHCLLGLV